MSAVKTVAVLIPREKQFKGAILAIERAMEEAGVSLEMPDIELSSDRRSDSSHAAIERADMVLAEISARNPNTMYLAGYAQGIGKRVVFLALHGEDIPFDRTRHAAIVYSGSGDFLKAELLAKLRDQEPPDLRAGEGAREKFDSIFGDIMKAHGGEHTGAIEMENEKTFILRDQDLDLPLVQDLARKARELGYRIKLM